jgi:leukotriene-A4 hydrolase
VARLDHRYLGGRTGVYAEPRELDDTAYEMQFLPAMLQAGERVIGPYPFERYDLVFPPKYSGGMENPELNFIGQDQITGNHPAVVPPNIIIAHELSHAWFGDEVTLAEWNDVWVNEGFATYFEKRIKEEIGDPERSELAVYLDAQSLAGDLPGKPARLTVLHRTFEDNERPVFTVIPYAKGEMFLRTLDGTMGRAAFDDFIHVYLLSHANHWVDDVAFRDALLAQTSSDPDLQSRLQIDAWLYGSGMPSNYAAPASSAIYQRIQAQADALLSGTPASKLDTTGWTSVEVTWFLPLISGRITPAVMDAVDAKFGFSQMNTPPTVWLSMIARTLRTQDRAVLDRYLARGAPTSLSVWGTLASTSTGRAYAVPLFNQVRDVYDPATAKSIQLILGL